MAVLHRTGLPKKLLDLFAPPEPPVKLTDLKKPKIRMPYTGIAQYVPQFADQGDPEYEPVPSGTAPASPRLFANPELQIQARVEDESIWERYLAELGCLSYVCLTGDALCRITSRLSLHLLPGSITIWIMSLQI